MLTLWEKPVNVNFGINVPGQSRAIAGVGVGVGAAEGIGAETGVETVGTGRITESRYRK